MGFMRLGMWHLAVAITAFIGLGAAPAFASACGTGTAREHITRAGTDYHRVPFTASAIDPADPRYAWRSSWGNLRLERGFMLSSADPALYQIVRYTPVFSTGLVRSGQYIQFEPVSYADRNISEIRLVAAPELGGGPPIGSSLTESRPGSGPTIAGYRFQMAERLGAESRTYLGLWRRTGSSGARTLLVLFSRPPNRPDGYETRIVGRSELAFSLISRTDTFHGGDWSFTLFTEAACPAGIAMLSYHWTLYIPRAS